VKEREAWIHLALVKGTGPKLFQTMYREDLSPLDVLAMDKAQLKSLGCNEPLAATLSQVHSNKLSVEAEKTLEWESAQDTHHLVTWLDSNYPTRLKHIASPPPLLMIHGNLEALSLPQIALVGSRYPTQAGQAQAFEFSESLADMGFVITSGLARGVDTYAHKGCLQTGGMTVAVLGTGLNQIYPKQNKRLAEEIVERGALVSEFALSIPAMSGHFPRRNRIVSGLSLGVLVIEATLKSGSLITARQALEQNREVMALPGALSNPQKAGCHYLIQQGAELIETPQQILNCVGPQALEYTQPVGDTQGAHSLKDNLKHDHKDGAENDLQPEQVHVLNKMDYDGLAIDEIAVKSRVPIHELTVTLMDLELSGLIRQEQGLYSRI